MADFGASILRGASAGQAIGQAILAPEQRAIEERKLALQESQANTGQRAVAVQESQLEEKQNTPESRYNRSLSAMPVRMKTNLTQIVQKVPEMKAGLQPFIDELVDGKYKTRGDAIDALMALPSDPSFKEARAGLIEAAANARKRGDNKKAAVLEGIYEETSADNYERLVDTLTGKPQSMWRTASDMGANIKAPVMGEKPYWDEKTQSWLQRKSDGTVVKVAQSPSGGKGRRFYDANGNLIYEEGDVETLTRKTEGEVQTRVIDTTDEIIRLESIIDKVNPEFLTVGGKARATFIDLKNKLSGDKALSADDKQYIGNFTRAAQDSVENINLYIKRITGAQMSEKEAQRLKLAQPDFGKTWFTGDGPAKFRAKALNALSKAKAANARYEYYLSQGLNADTVSKMINAGTVAPLEKFEQAQGPKIGQVQDGYEFIGGDPASPSSWKEAK